ncbi:MAG: sulfatase [Phycisphaerae bacterium]
MNAAPPRWNRRRFLTTLGGAAAAAAAGCAAGRRTVAAENRPPNIVVIFTDDQGYQDLGCFGSPDIKTPNVDGMAERGMKFTDFYVAAPVCSASRAALLTGCYPIRTGITGVLFPKNKNGLTREKKTVAEILKTRGYATACIGKWHLGTGTEGISGLPDHAEFMPTSRGFDYYYGIPYSNDMRPTPVIRNLETVEEPARQATLTQRYTEEAVRFIREHQDGPFFLYVPHTMPHVPLAASERFRGKSDRGLYGDVIEEIDWSTGEILKTLRDLGLDEKTLVIYTSDNGPWLSKGKHGGSAKPLRDGKFHTWEGGFRMPCVMRWPGRIPADTVCNETAATIDLAPTFAALAGAHLPDGYEMDGDSILPLMEGRAGAETPHEAYFFYRGHRLEAVRAGKWKLILYQGAGKGEPGKPLELYDLRADIGETTNVAKDHPEGVKRLTALAVDGVKRLGGRLGKPVKK